MKTTTLFGGALALLLFGLFPSTPAQGPPPPVRPPQVEGHSLAAGTIIMWSGSLAQVPPGWRLCDGSNGTPDLRDRFVLGAKAGQEPGETGGAHAVPLTTANLPSHNHDISVSQAGDHSHTVPDLVLPAATYWVIGFPIATDQPGFGFDEATRTSGYGGGHSHSGKATASGAGNPFDHRPAYHRLAFLMKDPGPGQAFPVGSIVMWSQSGPLPVGWSLCDGTAGTPDLIGRFALSVRAGEEPGALGGADSVVLTNSELPTHDHPISVNTTGSHQHDHLEQWNAHTQSLHGGAFYYDLASNLYHDEWRKLEAAGSHTHGGSVHSAGLSAAVDTRPAYRTMTYMMRTGPRTRATTPRGSVVLWSGERAAIPAGWKECDGQAGRPDLRDRFVVGSTAPGSAGGAHQRSLSWSQMPSHNHGFQLNSGGNHDHSFKDRFHDLTVSIGTGGVVPSDYAFFPEIEAPKDSATAGAHDHSGWASSVGSGESYDNRPAYYRVLYIAKE